MDENMLFLTIFLLFLALGIIRFVLISKQRKIVPSIKMIQDHINVQNQQSEADYKKINRKIKAHCQLCNAPIPEYYFEKKYATETDLHIQENVCFSISPEHLSYYKQKQNISLINAVIKLIQETLENYPRITFDLFVVIIIGPILMLILLLDAIVIKYNVVFYLILFIVISVLCSFYIIYLKKKQTRVKTEIQSIGPFLYTSDVKEFIEFVNSSQVKTIKN